MDPPWTQAREGVPMLRKRVTMESKMMDAERDAQEIELMNEPACLASAAIGLDGDACMRLDTAISEIDFGL